MRDSIRKCLLATVLSMLVFSCAPTTRWGTRIDWKEYTLDNLPTQDDYPNAGAVILLDEANLEIFSSSGFAYSQLDRKMMIKILNDRGLRYANVTVPYGSGSEVSNIHARTILPNGKIIMLSAKEIYDVTMYPDFVFYSDVRAKRFTLPAVEKGSVIEYTWRKTVKNFTYWSRWQLQHEDPTLIARYTVRCPSEWEIYWKTYGVEIEPEIEKVPSGFKATRKWEVRDLPALVPEVGMPPGNQNIGHIMFSPVGMSTWDQIANWFDTLASERWVAHKPVRDFVNELVSGLGTEKEKLRRIFEFVRDNIRYVAIDIGTGGYQPHFASSVLRKRYGDCKDMTALIIAMAAAADISVRPVLISTWQNGKIDTTLASQDHFNHAIALAILSDSTEVWMDATEKTCSFEELPWYDQNRLVLVVEKGGQASFKRTPMTRPEENQSYYKWELDIDSTGTTQGVVEMTLRGAPANNMRDVVSMMQPASLQAWFGRDLLARFPDVKAEKIKIEHQKDYDKPLKIYSQFVSSGLITSQAEYYTFQPGVLSSFDWYDLFAEDERQFDICLRYPMQSIDIIEISYPNQWDLVSTLQSDSIASDYGRYEREIETRSPGSLKYYRNFQLDSCYVEKEKYEGFRSFLNQVAITDKNLMVFKKK